jgi:two-component system, sensor histidine kinase and response regulator
MTMRFDEAVTPQDPINRARLLAVVGGDRQLLVELIDLFLEQIPTLLHQIDDAIAGGDDVGLRRSAHTLKGSLATFAADEAMDAAQALERIGASGELHEAEPVRAALARALTRVEETLIAERTL